jgi:serine/threonine protein kinase
MGQHHSKISASNIYINEDQTVVLGDPWLLSEENNFNETMHGNIYPSPEKILFRNGYINEPDAFLSDLFSLGVALLEMYFLEHMDTIYEKGYRRIVETRLVENISNIAAP